MKTFHLTFQVVTDDSAQHGDFARHGYLTRHGELPATRKHSYIPDKPAQFPLREALEIFSRFNDGSGPVEADSCPISIVNPPRWLNTCNQHMDEYGENINVSLHLTGLTAATRIRIARLLGCYGLR